MGGANSTDKMWRQKNINWWKEELPNESERKYALDNLTKNDNEVDMIFTHTCYVLL